MIKIYELILNEGYASGYPFNPPILIM